MGASDLIQRYFSELAFLSANLPTRLVAEVVEHLMAAHARGATVFVIGNGGSAATASHFANDLLKSGRGLDGQRLRTFALTDSVPILTAVGNDLGYERVFSEQLAANARAGDVLIALSGSGNSPNVLRGVELARQMGLTTIALGGFGGGRLASMVDLAVVVPGSRIQVVEDAHSAICHAIAVGLAGALGADRRDQTQAAQPAVFCDRDGVLNRRRPDHVKSVEEFEFLPGVLLAMRELARLEVPVVVVTNQSVIGRGLASEAEVERIHARMRQAVLEAGGPKLHVYVCPHAPQESCECRKPRPGLLLRAAAQLDIDLTRSVFVGDSSTDVCAALSAGCRPILVGQDCSSQAFWPDGLVSYAPSLLEALGAIHLE